MYYSVADSLNELRERMRILQDAAHLVALEVVKLQRPAADEIPQSKAYEEFGYSWVKKHTDNGIISPRRSGKYRLYSRSALAALLEAERNKRAEIAGKWAK